MSQGCTGKNASQSDLSGKGNQRKLNDGTKYRDTKYSCTQCIYFDYIESPLHHRWGYCYQFDFLEGETPAFPFEQAGSCFEKRSWWGTNQAEKNSGR